MNLKNKVEAVLFAVGKKIAIDEISRLCGSSVAETQKALQELQKDYDSKEGSLVVSSIENMWKFNVKQEYLNLVHDLIKETDLDTQTMETLAMIAYLSPVMQSEIVDKRTPAVYDHVKQLDEMGFLTKVKKGRSRELKITDKFYDYFDIDKGRVKELFDKFKDQDLKIDQQEIELVGLEEERLKEQKALHEHIQSKKNPLSMGDTLNSVDGGVAPVDVENEYDEMLNKQAEEEKLRSQKRRERTLQNKKDGVSDGDEDDDDEETEEEIEQSVEKKMENQIDTLNKDLRSLRDEL